VADTYTYLGSDVRGYFAYVDTDTDQMLVAEPGESYRMRATEEGFPVPPTDGRWEEAVSLVHALGSLESGDQDTTAADDDNPDDDDDVPVSEDEEVQQ